MTASDIFKRLQKDNPNPACELYYVNPFTLMVAIMLSAQATDKGVNKAVQPLFEKVTTPQQFLDLGVEGLENYVKSINYYHTKVRHILQMAEAVQTRYKGQLPKTREELQTLPGVGRKTANVFLNEAFQAPTIPVDTHVFRVSQRLGLAKGKTPIQIETQLESVVPDKYKPHASHWLVLLGRYTCKARCPACSKCVVRDVCPSAYQQEKA